ncbi:MAG: hydroxyacid dehydrogenase [Ignavibacteria bacterium CG_4_8_14_3_um_filter_37_9]|nr:hydroxyacid dehydrogenase [Ignavibacteria bacterium]PIP77914.1 MAG: hydroxyacid dehydrogenase [Ignavibacteria bacterium CG22_combo_CG10-13_8_21_14_all_37_15]PIS45714.1 MAG: hydroxyacid dehydrogenase [Ignavibacteria bacterium CG08_land_8_20_14_0_20_37_9]PIW98017.1 MAG: hydroxyacid dehydrogenase [Ignavibacteria bacterium CG_4_8_14_3_um_filter_37_9]PJC57444.1 MAG: hydroxyacid dehydrogenase [Ignavibacteria bacterium CG_4_9_14_0_2_um_filter_37_13]
MTKTKIAFFEITSDEKRYIKKQFDNNFELFFYKDKLDEENISLIKDVDVVSIFIYSKITQKIIDDAKKIKLIATRSTGFNHINLNEAQKNKVCVCNVPYYGENTVAEHSFALILALSRNVHKAYVRTMQGNYSLEGLRGFDLKNKTIGVIGAGSIGMHVIKMAKGFGMKVIAFDLNENHMMKELLDLKYVSLEELLSTSDVLTLHCPYTEQTRYLINMRNIHLVKKGALFINTARSEIIEPSALYYAIDNGIFGGAGLDVFEGEELALEENQMLTKNVAVENLEAIMKRNILLRRENVIITPHMAFDSFEAVERILDTTVRNIKSFIAKENYHKVV